MYQGLNQRLITIDVVKPLPQNNKRLIRKYGILKVKKTIFFAIKSIKSAAFNVFKPLAGMVLYPEGRPNPRY